MSMALKTAATIADVVLRTLPQHCADNGDLVVMEGGADVPFRLARVFVVRAPQGAVRGEHAHKACAQFLTCPAGAIEVECDDGTATATYTLDDPRNGVLVPPGIWCRQTYRAPGSLLMVLCDRPYAAADYIRSYDEFRAYRRGFSPADGDAGRL